MQANIANGGGGGGTTHRHHGKSELRHSQGVLRGHGLSSSSCTRPCILRTKRPGIHCYAAYTGVRHPGGTPGILKEPRQRTGVPSERYWGSCCGRGASFGCADLAPQKVEKSVADGPHRPSGPSHTKGSLRQHRSCEPWSAVELTVRVQAIVVENTLPKATTGGMKGNCMLGLC